MSARKKSPATPEWIPPHWICLGLLASLTVLTYANSLRGKFVFDDLSIILQNSALMNVKTIRDAVSPLIGGGWRQLLFATYALNYYWSGLDTFSYHVVNVALHVINVWLVYGIVLAALREDELPSRFVALCGAAVFAVHTLLSGAVSYIAGRSSVLCGTFYFAAIYLFFKALKTERRQTQFWFFGLTALSAFLAWAAKQEAITLPLFLAAVVLLRAKKIDWRWIAALAAIPVLAVLFNGLQKVGRLRVEEAKARAGTVDPNAARELENLRVEVEQLRIEMGEVQERLDFAERIIARKSGQERLPGS